VVLELQRKPSIPRGLANDNANNYTLRFYHVATLSYGEIESSLVPDTLIVPDRSGNAHNHVPGTESQARHYFS